MDAVTRANLGQFVLSHEVQAAAVDKQFEYLSAYCVLASVLEDTLDLDSVVIGDGADCAIDTLAIIINGIHVTDADQVGDILENNKYLDAQFVFIQSTTSSDFDGAKINNFFFGVEDFLKETPTLPANDRMKIARDIKLELYKKAASFKRGNPDIYCYYVTTGTWQTPAHIEAINAAFIDRLTATNMLDNIKLDMVDARELQRLYRSTQNSLKAEIAIPNILTLPSIEGVDQSFLGFISASEYLKLITDEHGNIRKTVFYDNVRDFQGDNKVNGKIAMTLSSVARSEFVVRNNGVTVVAKSLTRTGKSFSLVDYHRLLTDAKQVTFYLQIPRTSTSQLIFQ